MALPSSTYDTATLVNPGSSLTDFTLIVDLSRMSAAWWAAVDTTDGTKGRAAKDSGPTELACDWIDFDSVNETGLLRVKWSGTLASSGTQTLRVYPPQAANASVSASDTYGSDNAYASHWIAYLPLGSDALDRTTNSNDFTAQGSISVGGATGKFGSATTFDGTDDGLEKTSAVVSAEPMTLMIWANNDTASDTLIAINNTGNPNDGFVLGTVSSGGNRSAAIAVDDDGNGQNIAVAPSALPASGTWFHTAAVFASDTSRTCFLNGSAGTENTSTCTPNPAASPATGIGINPRFDSAEFVGELQDAQIHNVALSADWIEHEYEQTNDQATFWGTWTNVPVSSGISIPVVMHHRRMMGVS